MRILTEEEFTQYDDEEIEPIYCPHCEKRGYLVQLGPRILEPNEPRPQDYEEWLECPTCYQVIPIYELPKEETIKDSIETIESPFEQGKFILESIPKRTVTNKKTCKKLNRRNRKRNKIKLDEDPEIDALLRIHGDRVNVIK
jgi:hypothetical protein